ncbi:MAG: leucine-rich repeat domain-containing protein [Clostridiales bacterium]|nr:leucine-rich repeat domain-containing protein [Clostridiales bacterium]
MDIKEKIKVILALLAVIATGIWVAIADGGAIPVIVAVVGTPILLAGIVLIIQADGESDASEAASTSTTPAPAKAAPAPAADTRKATSKTDFEMGTVIETGPWRTVYKLIKYHGHDETVIVPDGVRYIEKMAFTKDVKFSERFVPPTGHFYGEGLTREEDYRLAAGTWEITVSGGKGLPFLRKVILPESVKYIDDYAFCFCKNLEEINLPFGMQRIGKHAFHGCTSLKRIEVPVGTNVEDGAFEDTHTQVVHVTKKQATSSTQTTSKTSDNLMKEGNSMTKPPANKPSEKQPAPAANDRMPISLSEWEQMSETKKGQLAELCLCRGKDVPVDRHINMSSLFSACSSLKRLDLSCFRLAHVFGLEGMLKNCTKLEEVVLSDTIQQCTMLIPTGETERTLVPVPMADMEPNYSLGAQPSHAYADCDPYRYEDVPVMKHFADLTDKRRREFLGLVDGAKLTIVPHRTPPEEVKLPQPTFYSSASARQQNDEPSRGPRDVPSMMKSLEQEYMGDDWEENLRRELRY